MSLINDYLSKIETDYAETLLLVMGAEDNLDIAQGESVLTSETIDEESKVFSYLKARRDWLKTQIDQINLALTLNFDEIPVFTVSQSVLDEITKKQDQMKSFLELLSPIVLGADSGSLSIVPEPVATARKKK
jgi:hypothetical protein